MAGYILASTEKYFPLSIFPLLTKYRTGRMLISTEPSGMMTQQGYFRNEYLSGRTGQCSLLYQTGYRHDYTTTAVKNLSIC